MANYTAEEVKRLREATGAPMMDCKNALEEAGGDYEKAKTLLREKGKAAADKRSGRATSEGVVAFSEGHDRKHLGVAVLECETDFVARNEDFLALAGELAEIFLHHAPGADPMAISHGNKTVGNLIQEAVAKIRENIRLTRAEHLESPDGFVTYVYNDKKKGSAVEVSGSAKNAGEVAFKVAVQSIAFPPEFLTRDEVPKDAVDAELQVETQRAINEGKSPEVAKNIAQGRVNKEFYSSRVLMDQPYYADPKKTVSQFVQEEAKAGGGDVQIKSVKRFAVGENG